jgi:hypothetical protein
MRTLFRKLRGVKKLEFLKRSISVGLGALVLNYGRINQTTNLPINSNQEVQSISRETESSFTELTYSQEEIDALGLGNADKKVTLVVGLLPVHSYQHTLSVHEENLNRLVQENNIVQKHKILLIRTKSDLKNPQWIKEYVCKI